MLKLVVNDVLRNSSVRTEIYNLVKDLLTIKEVNTIEDALEKVLVDVLNMQSIRSIVSESKNFIYYFINYYYYYNYRNRRTNTSSVKR